MNGIDLENVWFIGFAFAIGGILKGATGAGAPIVAVPVLALFYNVQIAVALFVMPNIISNLIQLIQYRKFDKSPKLSLVFAMTGIIGAGLGTVLLALLSSEMLMLAVALVVLAYITFRLTKPEWKLDRGLANRLVVPLDTLAGILQGAAGISAPISITFLNSLRLERPQFIATISLFFIAMGIIQLPLQAWFGIMNWERFLQSCLAIIPLALFMPVGAMIGKRLSAAVFDQVILSLLGLLSVKMIWEFFL